MLCYLCKEREAKVHLSQYEGCEEPREANLVAKIDLCEDCARKHGVNDPAGFSLTDLLTAAKKARGE
jgi:protein-arginine kinase activator protein McsA